MCKKAILLASFVLVLALAPGAGAATPNLVCWWKFDGNADDSSGYACHGTENGGPAYTGGYDGQAIDLDGVDDYVEYSFAEETWSAHTVALWVRTDTLGQDNYSAVFNNNSSGGDFQFDVDGQDNYQYHGSDDELFGPVTTDWVHLAATCDGADTKLYFNGNQVVTIAAADTVFGRYAVGINRNTTNCFAGDIDDVRIYDRALTPAEIKALAQSGEATLVSPADGAMLDKTSVLLTWERGRYAADMDGHDVYLCDNFEDVDAGSGAASVGLTSNEFYYIPVLDVGKIYYWRIVEVNDLHPGTPWPSEIWSFTVPEATAWDPSPADGAKLLDTDVTLSWQMGLDGAYHQVYLGQSFEDVNAGAGGTYRGREDETSYTPGPRLLGTTYYWRIDTVKSDLTVEKGPVWSFTTRPFTPIVDPSLVGWWKLDDEGSSVVARDYSGYDNYGTLKGDPQWVPGHDGDALQLDGVNDWVAIENLHYDSSGLEEVTVMAWVRTGNSGNQAIASFDRSEYWRLEVNGNGAGAGQIGWSVMTDA
ncbi:MAG: LamG domain-containing protein, partial [Planctomycetes bacterium]|nr:LamG domain-containing protein [Planctomycetota bacterium]